MLGSFILDRVTFMQTLTCDNIYSYIYKIKGTYPLLIALMCF